MFPKHKQRYDPFQKPYHDNEEEVLSLPDEQIAQRRVSGLCRHMNRICTWSVLIVIGFLAGYFTSRLEAHPLGTYENGFMTERATCKLCVGVPFAMMLITSATFRHRLGAPQVFWRSRVCEWSRPANNTAWRAAIRRRSQPSHRRGLGHHACSALFLDIRGGSQGAVGRWI